MIPRGAAGTYARTVKLQLASPHHLGNPARIAARLSLTAPPSHCYYRRGYSAGPTPSPSTNSSAPKDTLASPNNGPSLRKKVDLHPAPRKPTAAEVSTTPPKPPPPAPSASSNQSAAPTEKHNIADANPETEQASAIRFAIEDMQKATQHGILAPPPENAGTARRLLHQGIQLFKFYIRGIKLIGVHGKTVRAIRKRLATEQAEGKEARMTRWESQFIKTYNQDIKKLVPFLLIVLIIEEIIPLIVMYVPGILPSTCILPSQLERIQTKAENTRKGALKSVSSLLKDVKMEDLKSLVAGGLKSFDGALLKELCRVFGHGSWGPGILARRRLERHLEYLKTDDALLVAEGKGIRLSVPELRIALWDRGFVVDGVAESALRSKLANWVDAANNKEDADRLQMVLKSPRSQAARNRRTISVIAVNPLSRSGDYGLDWMWSISPTTSTLRNQNNRAPLLLLDVGCKMPFRPRTLPETVQLRTFIDAYPHPAFVLNKRVAGKHAASLMPIFSNAPFRNLAFGPKENEPRNIVGGLLEALSGSGFEGLANARRLGEWIEHGVSDDRAPFLVELEPPWLGRTTGPVQFELIKTAVEAFWIITSVPRNQTPKYVPPLKHDDEDVVLTTLKAESLPVETQSLRPLPKWAEAPAGPAALTQSKSPYERQSTNQEPLLQWLTAGTTMRDYVNNYPWENHPLGPLERWPQSLKSALSAAMAAPYPWAVWWGPDLTVLYNDAYAAMCGTKHPGLFAKAGKIAWGELWEELGPLSDLVLREKKSVAFEDDLLFFGRLTDKLLPEETYHSWAYIPVIAEDGNVGGLFNTSFENTSKILYERRIQILRALGDKTGLAHSREEFAQAMKDLLLEDAHKDIPFVAFYFNVVDALPKYSRDMEHKQPHKNRTRVTSTLAFKIGVPEGHPAIPDREVHSLDPTTLRPVLPFVAKHTGTSPGSTVLASSLSGDSTVVANTPGETVSEIELEQEPTPIRDPGWPFFDVFREKKPLHVTDLPSTIGKGFGLRKDGWNDVPREAIVMPIVAEGDEVPVAVMLFGVNTRRPYDKEYQTWIELLHITLNSTMTATLGRESELKKVDRLAQLDAAKTSFFSSASHELRTPLTLIAGPVQEALRMTTDVGVEKMLSLTTRNIERLQKLVDSLMDFTRVEADRMYGRFRATCLVDFTTDLAELFRNPIEKNHVKYIVTSNRTDEATAYVDHDLWEKIVFNLVGNAFKYTLAGQVHVHSQYRPGWAEFSVSDTGCGIDDKEQGRVFERFHRSSATARSHEGTGIGLALTRELVKLHGGYIALESIPEDTDDPEALHGSTFTVHIPLGYEHLPPANVEEDTPPMRAGAGAYGRAIIAEAKLWNKTKSLGDDKDRSEGGGSDSNTHSSPDSSKSGEFSGIFRFSPEDTILIVDDNSDVRKFLRSILRPYCNIIEAQNGIEGLVAIEEKTPDLVLSDDMMPGMDGIQFVSTVRERPKISWMPFILLTAKSAEEARVEGLTSGADDYISKPFKTQELIARAHLHLNLGKRKRELMSLFEERTKEIKIVSDLSPVGIFRTDSRGEVIYTNRRWHEITDYPSSQPLTNWLWSVHPEFQKAVLDLTTQALNTGDGGSMEIRLQNECWTKLQVEKIANGLIGTVTDVSDRHLYEAARIAQAQEREATAQLRAADAEQQRVEADERRRAQELLVDVTSHELRQPVSAILNCSQLVRTNLSNIADALRESGSVPFVPTTSLLKQIQEDLDALDSIYQCGLSQERIANDVLSLSRLQLDTLSIHMTDFHLVLELERIISIFANELNMKNIDLDVKIGRSIAGLNIDRVSSDRTRFAQILTNLMSNAIKFADIGPISTRQIVVVLDAALDPPQFDNCAAPSLPENLEDMAEKIKKPGTSIYIYVAVHDSGPGLKPGDLALLFQRFQQGSNSHEVFGGSGLGLFVSRKLCELMGGNIDVDSVYGRGATFRFYLKMKTAGEPTLKIASPLPPPSVKAKPIIEASPSQTAYHILITEDNIINQTVLNRQLKHAGFTTELASNGKEALEKIKHLAFGTDNIDPSLPRRFDTILMDCEMPVMDGHTATREIRRLESEGVLPLRNRIIALTGNARQGQVEASFQAGMDDVMTKPYKIDELVLKIRERALLD